MLDIITPDLWGQIRGRGWGTRGLPARYATLHYSASAGPPRGSSFEEDARHVRFLDDVGFERFGSADFDSEGRDRWPGPGGAGVSYTMLVSLSARVFEGHEVDRQSSHTKGYNEDGVGVCVMYDGGPVSDEVIDALARCLVELVLRGELTTPKFTFGHRDVYSTECPGDHLYARIVEINRRASVLWKEHQEENMSTTALGWDRPSASGTRRVGPHIAHPDNPREILFRNHATADLLAAVMWLIHTGNGSASRAVYVSQWHGARPINSGLGDAGVLSDHHALVAMDINWSAHPWEKRTGTAAYDRHLKAMESQHTLFTSIESRLGMIARWCGRDWTAPNGNGYARRHGNRDCMHWVIYGPYWDRINTAAEKLRTWFRPPHTEEDVKSVQRAIGIKADGVWGHGSVNSMYAWEKKNGLTGTGLPGTVAFWKKVADLSKPAPAPKPSGPDYSGFTSKEIRDAQVLLKSAGWYTGANTGIDGEPGPNFQRAMRLAQNALKTAGLYRDAIDLLPGPNFMGAIREYLKPKPVPTPKPDPKPEPLEPVTDRLAGADRYETAALIAVQAPKARQAKVYLGVAGTPDVIAAAAAGDGVVLFARADSDNLPGPTRVAIEAMGSTVKEIVPVGDHTVVSDAQARAAQSLIK